MIWLSRLRSCCFSLIFTFYLLEGIQCLQMVAMHVPSVVSPGEQVRLAVEFRLDGNQLYSIKWYKDGMEFYRFVPSDLPPAQFFPLEGLKIDMARSLNGTVFIKDVDLSATGFYRVEVSADAPSFQTIAGIKQIVVQEEDPTAREASSSKKSASVLSFVVAALLAACLC